MMHLDNRPETWRQVLHLDIYHCCSYDLVLIRNWSSVQGAYWPITFYLIRNDFLFVCLFEMIYRHEHCQAFWSQYNVTLCEMENEKIFDAYLNVKISDVVLILDSIRIIQFNPKVGRSLWSLMTHSTIFYFAGITSIFPRELWH